MENKKKEVKKLEVCEKNRFRSTGNEPTVRRLRLQSVGHGFLAILTSQKESLDRRSSSALQT